MAAKKGSYKEQEMDCPPNIERQNPIEWKGLVWRGVQLL